MPLTPRVPSAEEVESFSDLHLTGLLALGASEGPVEAFLTCPISFTLPPSHRKSQSPKELLCLFLSHVQLTEQSKPYDQKKASIQGQVKACHPNLYSSA